MGAVLPDGNAAGPDRNAAGAAGAAACGRRPGR